MSAESSATGLPHPPKTPRNPISRSLIETVVARSVAIFGVIYAISIISMVPGQAAMMIPGWSAVVNVAIFGGLVASLVAAFAKRAVRAVNGYVAISWVIAMASWPLFIADPLAIAEDRPWLWFLATVATAAAAVAWKPLPAGVALIALPVTYGVVRLTPSGGAAPLQLAALDVIYAILLGGGALVVITLLRDAADNVDRAQSAALDRYALAVGQHATEVERVQVDAIVHDSVLTTLLSAARATTPQAERLAGRMATNAMGYLRSAALTSPDDSASVRRHALIERITTAAGSMAVPIEVRPAAIADEDMPLQVAEAIYSAAVQAMVNSAQHAGGAEVPRWVGIRDEPDHRLVVEVGDAGTGFDAATIPTERIGLRVSIIERMANAGGRVSVASSPTRGTRITMRWPAPLPADSDAFPQWSTLVDANAGDRESDDISGRTA